MTPLRYGTAFKKAFGDREVFSRFASDVLGITVDVPVVHTEYSYPEAVGRVKVEYDTEVGVVSAGMRDLTPRDRAAPLHRWRGAPTLFSRGLPPVGGESPLAIDGEGARGRAG